MTCLHAFSRAWRQLRVDWLLITCIYFQFWLAYRIVCQHSNENRSLQQTNIIQTTLLTSFGSSIKAILYSCAWGGKLKENKRKPLIETETLLLHLQSRRACFGDSLARLTDWKGTAVVHPFIPELELTNLNQVACSRLSNSGGERKIGASEEKNEWGLGMASEEKKKREGGRGKERKESLPSPCLSIPNPHSFFFVRSPPPAENLEQARIKYLKSMNSITTCGTLINNVDSADESVNEILKVWTLNWKPLSRAPL